VSWQLPSALVIGGLATLIVVALHFITRSEPRPEAFPTARFVPDRSLRARARTLSLSDLILLALRALAVLALAAAVAGPLRASAQGRVLRIIALDRSRAVANAAEVRDSARSLARAGDAVVAFDTGAALVALDSLALTGARGSLSVALAGSIGMATRLADRADSIELVIVSPFGADELDDATLRVRRTWPGRIRLVRVAAATTTTWLSRVEAQSTNDDPVVAALALAGARAPAASIRLVRAALTSSDTAWARGAGHVLVHWPATDVASWQRRAVTDTVGAAVVGRAVIVAPFARRWTLAGQAVARWVDGEAAAVEQAIGDGCIRDVAIPVDPASDLALRPAFRAFLSALLVPCGGARGAGAMSAADLQSLAGPPGASHVGTAPLRDPARSSPMTPWLLALGAALLIVELGARRTRSAAT
jgi:hypothetical protein